MTARELWHNIMHYGEFDRLPVFHWKGWSETRERWLAEGMPADISEQEYFDAISPWFTVRADLRPYPGFEEITLEETEDYRILRDGVGVIQKVWKHQSSIPHYIDFTLKSANDWDEYKKRLEPNAGRIADDLDDQLREAEESGAPIAIETASMMGWIRNWMGVENMCYLMYDAPDVYGDMVNTLADLTCWALDQVIPRMPSKPDFGFGWEDICGKTGPLVSPDIFRKHVAPGYRKMREKLEEYGVTLLAIDSDGDTSALAGEWLAAGVNVQLPIEIGTWHADPMALRKQHGKELRMIGGFNKLVLEEDRQAIDGEIERRIPLLKDGGFVMIPDHLITPGTSLDNYKYFLDRVRNLRF